MTTIDLARCLICACYLALAVLLCRDAMTARQYLRALNARRGRVRMHRAPSMWVALGYYRVTR